MSLPGRVLGEEEATALRSELENWEGHVASGLLRTEAIRACARSGPSYARLAADASSTLALLPLDEAILDSAVELAQANLRTLDALHLATALSLGRDLGTMLVYDARLAEGARLAGLAVLAPGA